MVDGPSLTQGQGHARLHGFSWCQTAHAGFRHTTARQARQRHSEDDKCSKVQNPLSDFEIHPLPSLTYFSFQEMCAKALSSENPFCVGAPCEVTMGHKYLFCVSGLTPCLVLAPIFGNLLVFVPYRV